MTPNVIIVDIDTLRADHLGCYGYSRATSPNIDAFSEESILFEWAFAQAPNTPPSQSSILTGMYPTSHGRIGNEQKIPDRVETFAEVLRNSGYATAAFVDGGLMVAGYGMEQGFDVYDDAGGHLKEIGPKVMRWIDEHLRSRDTATQPILLLVHTYDVHSPYELSPDPYRSTFVSEVTPPPATFRNDMSKFMADVWNRRLEPDAPTLNEIELQWAKAMYDGGIRHVDAWFGEFQQYLEKRGLLDNSYVVIISDHGDEFQEHGSLFHDKIYASVTRVPLIIRPPAAAANRRSDRVVETIDLAPTLLDALELEIPTTMQGRSLMPILRGEALGGAFGFSESPYYGRRIAVTAEDLRLILSRKSGNVELYRFRHDRLEQNDIAAEHAADVERLTAAIDAWERRVTEAASPAEEGRGFSEEAIEQLKTLGYIQ